MNRTLSVWRWQFIFTASMITMAVVIAALRPAIYAAPPFVAGLALVVITTLVVVIVPWHRLPSWCVVLAPLMDVVAISLTTAVQDIRLGFMWVFPVTWIAMYFSMGMVFAAIALITVSLFISSSGAGDPPEILLRALIVILTLSFLGITIHMGKQRSVAATRLLRRQSEQVNRAAARAATHQRRVTQIVDALDTALVAVAADGSILSMNDAYRRLYGRDRFGASLPAAAVEYDDRRGEPLPPDRTSLARAIAGDEMSGERFWLFDAHGRWRTVEVTTAPIASGLEDKRTTLVIIDDITDVLDAERERQEMSAIVSHELRNPLTAILGHVDLLLERDDLPDRVAEQLEIVANASERMNRLVSSVLDESRPDAGMLSEPVDLRQVVDASVASFLPTATSKAVAIDVQGADTLLIYGDAFRLRQVVDNVLSNAVKYTPSGGAIVLKLGIARGCMAELTVTDTGAGMSEADLQKVFEPYFRAEQAVMSGIPGTGLGMGIIRDIVVAHEGSLTVSSDVGVGTTVALQFPRRQGGPAASSAPREQRG